MDEMTGARSPADFDEAREAAALIFAVVDRQAAAYSVAAWAAEGLAPMCSDWIVARCASRVEALDLACGALSA